MDEKTYKIKTTYGHLWDHIQARRRINMILCNNIPSIMDRIGESEELYDLYYRRDDDGEIDYDADPLDIYQWYILDADAYDIEYINKIAPDLEHDIKYIEALGLYVLAVYSWGISWRLIPYNAYITTDAEREALEIAPEYTTI